MLQVGKPAIPFSLPASDGNVISLSDYQGKWVVLYFYPKDQTPGCTTEACDFRDYSPQFTKHNTVILGISRDSVRSHERFITKHELPFLLLSDETGEICEQYDVIKDKNMFGKKVRGIERTTFVIDPSGTVKQIYRKVKVKNHVEEVLSFIQEVTQ